MDPVILIFSFFILLMSFSMFFNKAQKSAPLQKYSILIAIRNEQHNLPFLLSSLKEIDYPKELYEIIFIDDASEDNSIDFIREFCELNINTTYYQLGNKSQEYKGKKAALKLGVEKSRKDILLFTDADCIIGNRWLSSFNQYFNKNVGLVIGWVAENSAGKFPEFIGLMKAAIYAVTTGFGIPFSASGGNLAIRKIVFDEVSGYDHIKHYVSGDDKLLLNLVKKTRWKISFNSQKVVETIPIRDRKIKQEQLKRRYGKFGMSSPFYKIIQMLIFIFYLYLPIKIIFYPTYDLFIYIGTSLVFYFSMFFKFKGRFNFLHLIYLQFYPYYLIFNSIRGMISSWEWKN